MTTYRARIAGALFAALAATTVAIATPASSAPPEGIGYTTVGGEDGCQLATVDLATGVVDVLDAEPSDEACVNDLAAQGDTVVGILVVGDPEAEGPAALRLVSFDPSTGAPTAVDLTVEGGGDPWLAYGGIAFDADGTLYAHIVDTTAGCDGSYVCLYEVDTSTNVATLVGSSGLFETELYGLATCGASLVSLLGSGLTDPGPRLFASAIATTDPATGTATAGASVEAPMYGIDCDGGTIHVLTVDELRDAGPGRYAEDYVDAGFARLGTLDLATGTVTDGPELTGTQLPIALLAIPSQAPEPQPTTTTTSTSTTAPTTSTTARPVQTAAVAATPVTARPAYTG